MKTASSSGTSVASYPARREPDGSAAFHAPQPRGRPGWTQRRWVGPMVAVVGISVAAVFLRNALPNPAEVWQTLKAADGWWLALAAAAQFASMVMFAQQQRLLLGSFGVSMPINRAIGLTYARTAISIAMPAGAAIASGFALRQFRLRGADAGTAAAVIVLSGVQSLAALVVVYLAWFATVGIAGAAGWIGMTVAAFAAAAIAAVVGLLSRFRRMRDTGTGSPTGRRQIATPAARRRWPWIFATLDLAAGSWHRAASMSPRDWAAGGGYAMANWLGDLVCLIAAAHALGLGLGIVPIVGAYLAVQVIRQIPLTPGGIGLIEASLLVALVAAGATHGTAAAVVLTYRLLSCWIVAPIGLLAWAGLRAAPTPVVADGGKYTQHSVRPTNRRVLSEGTSRPRTFHYGRKRMSPVSQARADPRRRHSHGPRTRRCDPAP